MKLLTFMIIMVLSSRSYDNQQRIEHLIDFDLFRDEIIKYMDRENEIIESLGIKNLYVAKIIVNNTKFSEICLVISYIQDSLFIDDVLDFKYRTTINSNVLLFDIQSNIGNDLEVLNLDYTVVTDTKFIGETIVNYGFFLGDQSQDVYCYSNKSLDILRYETLEEIPKRYQIFHINNAGQEIYIDQESLKKYIKEK